MVKVVMEVAAAGKINARPGDVVDVSAKTAKDLIDGKFATSMEDAERREADRRKAAAEAEEEAKRRSTG